MNARRMDSEALRIKEERDEFMDFYRQFRPDPPKNASSRSSASAPRSVLGSSIGTTSELGTISSSSYGSSVRDNNMALPRHRKMFVKSKSVGRDPRFVDLQNSYKRLDNPEYANQPNYLGPEVRYEDSLSRDSGNSSGGTPECGRRSIIRHNSYPSPFAFGDDIQEDRFEYPSTPQNNYLRRQPLDSISLVSNTGVTSYDSPRLDSVSLRSFDSQSQGWGSLGDQLMQSPRLSKRKFSPGTEIGAEEPQMSSPAKRSRTPEPKHEGTQEIGLCGRWLRKLFKLVLILVICAVILVSGLLLYELVRKHQCGQKSSLGIDAKELNWRLSNSLYGQYIAHREIVSSIEGFLDESRVLGAKPLLVMILAGWIGSGKTLTASIISSVFPVAGNIHSLVPSTLHSTNIRDLHSSIQRSCGYSLVVVNDVETEDEASLHRLERLLVSLAAEDETAEGNGTLVVLTTSTGAHSINRYMLELARTDVNLLDKLDGDSIREYMDKEGDILPLKTFLSDYSIPVVTIPFLPLRREHVRSCVHAELKRVGASMSAVEVNQLLDEIQFFSKDLPIFAKTGCKKIAAKVTLALSETGQTEL